MTDPNTPIQPPAAPQYPSGAQQYESAPPPAYGAPAQGSTPGKTLGIVAFVLALVPVGLQLIGLILGIVALVQSKKAGRSNGWALAAIIIGALAVIAGLILLFAVVVPSLSAASTCVADPTAIVTIWGIQVPCSEVVTS